MDISEEAPDDVAPEEVVALEPAPEAVTDPLPASEPEAEAELSSPPLEAPAPLPQMEAPVLSAHDVIANAEREDFSRWAIGNTLQFLEIADADPVQTVEALRGQTEAEIADRIQMANSTLVLLANYGSKNDDQSLVDACGIYAEKMQTIIKRLCL